VIEGLKGIEDTGTKNTVAMALFGRSFQDLSGYMLMSKSEMQGYFDKGFAPTSEQEQKLRDYEQALKDLNTTTGKVATEGGMALSGSLKEWTQLMNDAFNDDSPIISFFETLDGFLTLAARGFHILGSEALAAYQVTQFNFSGAKTTLEELNTWVQNKARDDRLRAAGFKTDGNGNAVADETKTRSSDVVLPDSKDKEKALSATEIQKIQNDLDDLTDYTIPKQRDEVKKLEKAYKETGDKSSQAAKDAKREWEHAQNALNGYLIQQQEAIDKLTKAGVPTSTGSGGSSYNELFKSSLDTGGVGPDYAGFSDLASMSQSELEKIAAGGLGKSKAMAEKAQAYLARMKAGSSSASSTAKKDLTPGSTGQTDSVKTEYDKQATALETLADKTVTAYQKQGAAFQTYMDGIRTLREEKYPVLETLDLIHFATFEETARVAQQKVMDNMAGLVNFAGENIITQYVVIQGSKGPDWTPPTFTPIKAPTLESADFTQVGASVQKIVAKGLGDGTSGSKAAEAAVTKVTVVVQDKTSGGVKAELASVNGGIGGRS